MSIKKIALLLALLATCATARAQNGQRISVLQNAMGQAVPSVTVTVCAYNSANYTLVGTIWTYTGPVPCTSPLTVYADPAGSNPITAPLLSSGNGNYSYWAASGNYTECLAGIQIRASCYAVQIGGSGGGAGNPAAPQFCIQIANAGVTAFATASFSGKCFGVDSATSPTIASVPFNLSVAGPRPSRDVTAYGADPTGSADSTAAIQAAITAACSSGQGSIYFPPGNFYKVLQPQTPSTSAVFTICNGLHFIGGQGQNPGASPAVTAPQVTIATVAGASPNAAPIFFCGPSSCSASVTFENLDIIGYNQAVSLEQTSNIKFVNTITATSAAGATGLTDNTPLKICNSVELTYQGGAIETNNTTAIPAVLFCSDSTAGNFTQVGIAKFADAIITGGNFKYSARVQNVGPPAGNLIFSNLTFEGQTLPMLDVTETTPGFLGGLSGLTFDHVNASDNTPVPLIKWESTTPLSGVDIKSSFGGTSLIQMQQCNENTVIALANGAAVSNVQIVDASGNPCGNAMTQNWSGFDYITNTANNSTTNMRLQSDVKNLFANLNSGGLVGPAMRLTPSGAAFATLAIDPLGIYLGEGSNYGFSTKILSLGLNDTDFSFSKLLPPTAVAGTATTGGSLANGTYYYYVRSSSVNSSTGCTDSTTSIVSSGVVLSGGNNAVNVSWTLPSSNSPATPAGFCVYRSTVANTTVEDSNALLNFVSGGTATTYSDTGGGTAASVNPPIPTHVLGARFTPTVNSFIAPSNTYSDTGSSNAYIVTTPFALTALKNGYPVCFTVAHSNTGTSTLNVDSVGAVAIKKNGNSANLASGDLVAGSIACLQYDGTQFEVQSTLGNSASGSGVTLETNGSNNASQATLNLLNSNPFQGITFTVTNTSAGNVQLGATGNIILPFQTNSVNNTTQTAVNFLNSSTNTVGLAATFSNPGTVQEKLEITGTLNPAGGGCGLTNPTAHSLFIAEGGSNCNLSTSPSVNGFYQCGFNVTASTPVDVSCLLAGIAVNPQSGNYALLYSDRAAEIRESGTTTATITLPQITGNTASNFPFVVTNFNSGTLTLTANAADKIDGGSTGGSVTVPTCWAAFVYQDNTSAPGNWWTLKVPMLCAFPTSSANQALTFNGTAFANLSNIFIGPGSSTDNDVVCFNSTTGLLGKECATPLVAGNVVTAASNFTNGDVVQAAGANKTTSDAGFLAANVVTNATGNASGANEVLSSAGANKTAKDSGIAAPTAAGSAIMAQRIASGTSALATGAISSATCATVVTTTATGTATTDVVSASFNGDPTAVTGYVPLTAGMLTIIAYPTANNVNFKVCNNTSSSITPGAITLNWVVVR